MNPRIVATGIPDLLPMARSGAANRHISAIIRSLCIKLGHFEDDSAESTPRESVRRQTMWELGSTFEDALISALIDRYIKNDPNRYARIGELTKNGLIGTVDLVDLTDWAVLEIKLTWMSSRHDAHSEKFWKYWVQLKAYCMMLGTRLGRLHVCHINGNYRDDRGPVYNVWEDEFTKQELEENWLMLTRHAKTLK